MLSGRPGPEKAPAGVLMKRRELSSVSDAFSSTDHGRDEVFAVPRHLALGRMVLGEDLAGPALRYTQRLADMPDACLPAGGAQ